MKEIYIFKISITFENQLRIITLVNFNPSVSEIRCKMAKPRKKFKYELKYIKHSINIR